MAVLNSANRLQLKLTGLHLRVAKVSVKLSRKIFGSLFLQINERAKQRKLFLRNKHSARLAKGGKKKKGGVFKKIGSAVKTVASKIGHAGGLVVHGARSLITNRIKCNGHVWGHLGGTDFQTDIYFSPGPKLAIRDSKVSIEKLHIDFKFDGLCKHAAGLVGKTTIVNIVKKKIQGVLDSKIRGVENMLAEKQMHIQLKRHLGYMQS